MATDAALTGATFRKGRGWRGAALAAEDASTPLCKDALPRERVPD